MVAALRPEDPARSTRLLREPPGSVKVARLGLRSGLGGVVQQRGHGLRWGARVCDLDLLAFGDRVLPDAATMRAWMALGDRAGDMAAPERLILPHPRLQERAFVLVPLADIAPRWVHPVLGRSVAEMLGDLPPEAAAGIARL